jgi:hypothetical protein
MQALNIVITVFLQAVLKDSGEMAYGWVGIRFPPFTLLLYFETMSVSHIE